MRARYKAPLIEATSVAPTNKRVLEFAGILTGVALIALVVYPYTLPPRRSQSPLTRCKSNLKNIGTALEMYSTDWSGAYPDKLSQLRPNYLKVLPACPAAGKNTYSPSYSNAARLVVEVHCPQHWRESGKIFDECKSRGMNLRKTLLERGTLTPGFLEEYPDNLTYCPIVRVRYSAANSVPSYAFYCQGDHHKDMQVPEDYPRYDAITGLVKNPPRANDNRSQPQSP